MENLALVSIIVGSTMGAVLAYWIRGTFDGVAFLFASFATMGLLIIKLLRSAETTR